MNSKSCRNDEDTRFLLSLLSDPAVIVDKDGKFLLVNEAFECITGMSRNELIGTSFLDLNILSVESKALLLKNLEKRIQGVSAEPYEVSFTNKTGETGFIEVKGKKVDYSGQPADLVVFHDITRGKENARWLKEHAEKMEAFVAEKVEETKESEDRLRSIFDSSPDAITLFDLSGAIIDCSKATLSLHGFSSKEELIGKNAFQLIAPRDHEKALAFMKKLLEGGTIGSLEFTSLTKDGQEFPTEGSGAVLKDGSGQPKLFISITRNITDRFIMEQALKESEEKYRKLFDEAIDAIFLADAETGIIVDCNQAALKLVGWEISELIGRYQNILHPEGGDGKFTETFKKHLEKQGETLETQIITKKGKIRDVAIKANILELDGIKLLQGIFRDITERKRMEGKLKRERDMLEAVTSNVGAGLTLISEDYRILWSNDLLKQMFGGDVEQKICYERLHNRGDICEDCGVKKVFEGAGSDIREFSEKDTTGRMVTVELIVTPVKDNNGCLIGALELAIPITERKLMEDQVQASEERFRAISNSVRDAIILVDSEGTVGYWNPAAERTFGYSREEAMGKKVHDLVVPHAMCSQGNASIRRGLRRFRESGTGAFMKGNVELVGRRKDGLEFPVKLSLSPIRLGNEWHVVGVAKDITERKQNEQMVREYAEKLEIAVAKRTKELKAANESLLKLERFAAIGELAGMVGHDLRNPLTGIKNAVYFLKKKGVSVSEVQVREMFETIDNCIDHSNKIINDLLDYSREIQLERKDCSLRSLLADALTMVSVPQKVRIQNNLPEKPRLSLDSDKIMRVFINVVKNAVDVMPDGGTITVDSRETHGNLEMSFSDTGPGIADDVLPKLFMPLITTKAQGMGFGLAICKRIVEAHGGTITVKVAKGKGTTFAITLPIEPESEVGGENVWINTQESLLSTTTKA